MVISPEILRLGSDRRSSGMSTETFDVGARHGSEPCEDLNLAVSVLEITDAIRERRWRADADVLRVVWRRPFPLSTVTSSDSGEPIVSSGEELPWSPILGLISSVVRGALPQEAIAVG